jgi:membrane-associated phospholipid phosphatase
MAAGPDPATETATPFHRTDAAIVRRARDASLELLVGALLIVVTAAGAAYLSWRPETTPLDRWLLDVVGGSDSDNPAFNDVTHLRYPVAVVVAAAVIALAVIRRDRVRALMCLIGPPLALVTSELAVKPLTGRLLGGQLSYPSGSTVGAAAISAAAVLATSPRWRVVTVTVAASYSLWMSLAVVAIGWHLPTDALAGVAYGVGVVVFLDGIGGKVTAALGPRSGRSVIRWSVATAGRGPARTPPR